ncbi:MAG: AsmA family protein, partial [Chromatiaceae bacterium]|nr:AsmA family protein [Chromatiaceae bacterium]
LGEDRFEGRLGVDLSRPRPKLDLDLSVDKIDTRPLFRQQVSGGGRSTTSAGSEGKSRDGLFSDRPLELDRIGAADVTARIRIRSLITPYTSAQATDIDVKLVARRVRADLKAVGSGNRTITAALEIDGSNDPVAIALRVDGDKLAIDSLVATSAAEGMIRGEMGFAIDLRGRGDSVGRIMRSLNGSLLLLAEQGEADLTHLSRLTPGVRDLFGLLARPQAELAQVNCGIAAFELESGRTNVAILIDTTDSTVVAQGLLDLGAETLDARVDPAPKGAHLEVPAPIVVRGQLANPEFRVEKSELLVSLADLVSKVAVPQLLLVDAFGAAIDENPCMKILSGVSAPAATGSRTGGLTESLSDTVGGAGAVVKGSAKAVERVGGAVIKGTGGIPEGIGGAAKGVFDSGRTEQSEE